jgi:tRNA G18 (ribose-2'-O)-methylase SpoU
MSDNINPMVCFRDRIQAHQAKDAKGLNVHDHLKDLSVPELKRIHASESRSFEVAFLNIEGDLNVSVMIRSACLMGAQRAHVIGRRKYDQRGTVGAQNYMPVERFDALNDSRTDFYVSKVFQYFHDNHLYPIFIEQGGMVLGQDTTKQQIRDTIIHRMNDWYHTPVIVMGNEATGIPNDVIAYCKLKIPNTMVLSIPQVGVIRSFNVSSAFAIACWEYTQIMGYNQ